MYIVCMYIVIKQHSFPRYHLFLPFLTSPTISDIILRKNYLFKGTRFQKKQFGWKEYADLPLFFANLSARINLTQFSFRVKSTFKILNVFFSKWPDLFICDKVSFTCVSDFLLVTLKKGRRLFDIFVQKSINFSK